MGFLPGVGSFEMMIVGIIALLLFGKNLPGVAKNLGKSFAEFKKGVSGFQEEIRNATRDAERTMSYSPPEQKPKPVEVPKVQTAESTEDDDFTAPRFDVS